MNANEVIARLASSDSGLSIHPNDHVNMSQSSNDVIPTTIHVSACLEINRKLRPALQHLANTIEIRAEELKNVIKTGRTHLMDAMPVSLGQELGAWKDQIEQALERIDASLPRLYALAQGGTAVGTGINAHPQFGAQVASELATETKAALHQYAQLFYRSFQSGQRGGNERSVKSTGREPDED